MAEPLRILFVDDDEDLSASIAAILTGESHRVEIARSGKRALELLEGSAFDLILTDIIMDDMDGMELLRALHKADSRVPVISMSGHSLGSQFLEASLLFGAKAALEKPFERAELLEAIRRALGPKE